jgi:hypothetical protein
MPKTVVKCSSPGCGEPATAKIAAPWEYGRFTELKTYAYSCPGHTDAMVEFAEKRPKPPRLEAGEMLGKVRSYEV